MKLFRCASVLAASVLVFTVAATDPAQAAGDPTTLPLTGDHLCTVETDEG